MAKQEIVKIENFNVNALEEIKEIIKNREQGNEIVEAKYKIVE